ncbi:hypothetical protein PJW08_06615 [Tenacibaculum finnmarkense]|nr:hypothetical protein PJW08_06615 [Tenacibaculum finnmarkense]SOS55647.1 conserved hypothetical protein [Tenacibaculum finnmarkense]
MENTITFLCLCTSTTLFATTKYSNFIKLDKHEINLIVKKNRKIKSIISHLKFNHYLVPAKNTFQTDFNSNNQNIRTSCLSSKFNRKAVRLVKNSMIFLLFTSVLLRTSVINLR